MDETLSEKSQEFTVEVFPDTVSEIIYLPDKGDLADSSYYMSSEDELDDEDSTEYEIGSVDTTKLRSPNLVLDESQAFVLLSGHSTFRNDEIILKSLDNAPSDEFSCKSCDFKTTSSKALSTHSQIHSSDNACAVCDQVFSRPSLLNTHFKQEHADYTCTICDSVCVGQRYFNLHMSQHDLSKFTCETCSATFTSGIKLMNHMEIHENVLLYACNICDQAFSSTHQVSIHLKEVHFH